KFDAPGLKFLLKIPAQGTIGVNLLRSALMLRAEGDESSDCFADVPFDWVKPIATIRQVGCADVLGRWQKVGATPRNQRAQRNAKWQRRDINVIVTTTRGMQIDLIITDTNG